MRLFLFLNDEETYSELEGCLVVGISSGNRRAMRALDDEDFDRLFEIADLVQPVSSPSRLGAGNGG
jgi:hypothetical protein